MICEDRVQIRFVPIHHPVDTYRFRAVGSAFCECLSQSGQQASSILRVRAYVHRHATSIGHLENFGERLAYLCQIRR